MDIHRINTTFHHTVIMWWTSGWIECRFLEHVSAQCHYVLYTYTIFMAYTEIFRLSIQYMRRKQIHSTHFFSFFSADQEKKDWLQNSQLLLVAGWMRNVYSEFTIPGDAGRDSVTDRAGSSLEPQPRWMRNDMNKLVQRAESRHWGQMQTDVVEVAASSRLGWILVPRWEEPKVSQALAKGCCKVQWGATAWVTERWMKHRAEGRCTRSWQTALSMLVIITVRNIFSKDIWF